MHVHVLMVHHTLLTIANIDMPVEIGSHEYHWDHDIVQ
jgi:hypothetical protein